MLPLKNTLLINGISSGITGIALLEFADALASLFGGLPVLPFQLTGLFLVLFSAFVLYTAMGKPMNLASVRFISFLDLTWVVASLLLLLEAAPSLSAIGSLIIAAVAAWVALMALLQWKGLKGISPGKAYPQPAS